MAMYLVPKADGRPIVVDKAVLFLGRHPDCDVILTKSRKVSRKHCCLAQVDDKFFLRDLGSMNGISVNGQRVQRESPVNVGDEILIGDVPFTLQGDEKKKRQRRETLPEPAAKPAPRPVPMVEHSSGDDLSREFPVAIPDEDASFKIESDGNSGSGSPAGAAPLRGPDRETMDDSEGDVRPVVDNRPVAYDDDDGSLPDV